ncbi:hypothetical protein RUM43_015060 [Polyplax serrata]|uniref:Uncharacterized protein n=1 Tax=Polyplax serrata TaxID=468196 RepID=A0AAN8RZ67_POLSC
MCLGDYLNTSSQSVYGSFCIAVSTEGFQLRRDIASRYRYGIGPRGSPGLLFTLGDRPKPPAKPKSSASPLQGIQLPATARSFSPISQRTCPCPTNTDNGKPRRQPEYVAPIAPAKPTIALRPRSSTNRPQDDTESRSHLWSSGLRLLQTLVTVQLDVTEQDFIRMCKTLLLKRVQDVYKRERNVRPEYHVRLARTIIMLSPWAELLYAIGVYYSAACGIFVHIVQPPPPAEPEPWWTVDPVFVMKLNKEMGRLQHLSHYLQELPPSNGRTTNSSSYSWRLPQKFCAIERHGNGQAQTRDTHSETTRQGADGTDRQTDDGGLSGLELGEFKRATRKAGNTIVRGKTEEARDRFKESRNRYVRELRNRKKAAWRQVLTGVQQDTWGLGYKILRGKLRRRVNLKDNLAGMLRLYIRIGRSSFVFGALGLVRIKSGNRQPIRGDLWYNIEVDRPLLH